MHQCPENWVAIGHAVAYYARAAHAFSAGIKCSYCMYVSMNACMHVCMYKFMNECMYICMYKCVCISEYMYVSMNACMYVYIYE